MRVLRAIRRGLTLAWAVAWAIGWHVTWTIDNWWFDFRLWAEDKLWTVRWRARFKYRLWRSVMKSLRYLPTVVNDVAYLYRQVQEDYMSQTDLFIAFDDLTFQLVEAGLIDPLGLGESVDMHEIKGRLRTLEAALGIESPEEAATIDDEELYEELVGLTGA